ncbi:DUF2335 domain-containing protein [Kitasatospora sp. NPDC004614]|uniref:DUF2335 domain-containing protein n=1 Tax=unclassified Kitasatospora TaxID=2633591 RepID=UPI0036C86A96
MLQELRLIKHEITVERRHRGPIPSPTLLAEYEQVQAGLAERIVAMAEREQGHRHELERTDLKQDYKLARGSRTTGLIALVVMASLAGYLAHLGHPGWATAVGTLDIAAVVGIFVTGQLRSGSQEAETTEAPSSPARDSLPASPETEPAATA